MNKRYIDIDCVKETEEQATSATRATFGDLRSFATST